jgi:hypothetical protein
MKIEILTALLSAMSLSRSPLASASSKLFSSSRKHSKEQHHQQEEVYDTTMATSISSSTKARLSSNTDHRFLQVLGMTWQQVGSDIDGEGAGDQSGYSVAVSGDGMRVIVGALYNDANGDNSGYARVYKEVDGNWFQVGSDLDGEAAGDESGWSVAMSGDGMRVIVGAPRNDANGVESSGHARVYKEVGGNWVQVGSDLDGEATYDLSGWSVAMSGDGMRVIVGAPWNDANGDDSGRIRVYKEVDGNLVQVGSDLDGEAAGDESGWSVAMSGDGMRVIVGAPRNDANGDNSGHARVYKEVDGNWFQVGSDLDGEAGQSGWSVAMSGDGMRVIVGAPYNDANGLENSGHGRVYKEVDGNWFQVGSDLDGEAGQSGWSVAISGDRMRVIVGAPYNGNGAWSGHARVYKEVDGNWVQVGSDLDGEAAYDLSGYSVAISGDGMRVIVGAPHLNDANGFRSDSGGHARVFQLLLVPPTDQPSSSAVSWSLNTNALIGLSFASVFLVLDGGLF